jgi:hypothetical protein
MTKKKKTKEEAKEEKKNVFACRDLFEEACQLNQALGKIFRGFFGYELTGKVIAMEEELSPHFKKYNSLKDKIRNSFGKERKDGSGNIDLNKKGQAEFLKIQLETVEVKAKKIIISDSAYRKSGIGLSAADWRVLENLIEKK